MLNLLLVFLLGLFAPELFFVVVGYFRHRKMAKAFTTYKINEKKLCKTPHTWIDTVVYTKKGPSKQQLCRVCGLIPGLNLMATQEGIDRVEEKNRIKEIERKLYKEFLALEDEDIKEFFAKELQGGLPFEKLVKLHTAATSFNERFTAYKMFKAEEIEKELKKSNA